MINREKMKQRGFIVLGGGMNSRAWMDAAKRQGFSVLVCSGYVELWK